MPTLQPDGSMVGTLLVVNPASGQSAESLFRVDTGDDIALIDPSVANAVGAVPTGSTTVEGIDGRPVTGPVYMLDLDLGSSGYLAEVKMVGLPIASVLGVGVLFGDDALSRGVLIRDGPARFWSFTTSGTGTPPPSPWIAGGILLGLAGASALALGLSGGGRRGV